MTFTHAPSTMPAHAKANGTTCEKSEVIALWRSNGCAAEDGREAGLGTVWSRSPRMHEVFRKVKLAARVNSTVLVVGESGTGKELVAQAIHQHSPRSGGAFVTMNMAAVPEPLIESELFGHIKGAFTGASAARHGRFEAAHGGTLFIDEIGDLEIHSQAKLLRILENRRVTPVGSNEEREVDVRVVAATHRNLERMCRQGTFRRDLYFRLNIVCIGLPPLRDRQEDIEMLVERFLDEFSRGCEKPRPTIDGELREFLLQHAWPGNVRQLRNCVESMVVLADSDRLTVDDLPPALLDDFAARAFDVPPHLTLAEVEHAAVFQAIERNEGNLEKAAAELGVSVRTVQRRMTQISPAARRMLGKASSRTDHRAAQPSSSEPTPQRASRPARQAS